MRVESGHDALAVEGGAPIRTALLPYGKQSLDEADSTAVLDVLRSDWITTGPKVAEFEAAFAEQVGAEHAVSFSSGTAALHGAVFAAALGPGDEAIVPPMTFASTANVLLFQGATPRFADVSVDTLNLDPDATARAIAPATRAMIAVDYAGHPADLAAFRELAKRHNLVLIEDASHALGASLDGRTIGTIADLTAFSFHPVKHITTAEGGMVTTADGKLARRMRMFRSHGIDSDPRARQKAGQWFYEMNGFGFNYRLPDLNCALGLSQLRRLEANVTRRREIAQAYGERLAGMPLRLPATRPGAQPAWHLYPVRLELDELRVGRAEVFAAMRAEGIGVNVHYIPVHLHPYYRERFGFRGGEFPVAEDAYERLLSLPMFHSMSNADIDDVVRAVTKVLGAYAR